MKMLRQPSDKQLWFAVIFVAFGCALLAAGFIVSPTGEIHPSVLTAFGEILTFSGALFGVDYSYRKRFLDRSRSHENTENEPTPANEEREH